MAQEEKRLKVLYYNHSAEVSGAEISLLLTISHMTGVDTRLVAPDGELLDRARGQHIEVIPVRSYRARMVKNPLVLLKGAFGTLRAGLELRRVVREESPDIVHANSIRAGLIAIIAVWNTSTKLFWHVRDNLPHNVVGRLIRTAAAWQVDQIIAISNAIRANFATSPKLQGKTITVYNGIDVNQKPGKSIRQELGVQEDRFVVGVVGQIAPWKRQHDAITAFSYLVQNVPDSELWIVGEPKFRDENVAYEKDLHRQVEGLNLQDKARFLGFRKDVMDIMMAIDVLLVPSENEPFGRVVIEAMLAGKPVIGTNGGGIPEIVVHGETGYLADLGDASAMGGLLLDLRRNDDLRESTGFSGRERVLSNFSICATMENIRHFYRQKIGVVSSSHQVRPKIAVIAFELPVSNRRSGGVSHFNHRLCNTLVEMGYDVTAFSNQERPSDAKYHVQPISRDAKGKENRFYRYYGAPIQGRCLSFCGYNLVISSGDDWAMKHRGVPWVRIMHGSSLREAQFSNHMVRKMNLYVMYALEVLSVQRSTVTLYNSKDTRNLYPQKMGSQVIHLPVDQRIFHPGVEKEQNPTILFVGGLDGRKRGRWLLHLFEAQIKPALPNSRLWMVSEDDKASPGVTYFGQLDTSTLAKLYRRAHVFCMPSTYEGFGIPYLEAMASGTLVVTTPNPGADEILHHGQYGCIVADEDLVSKLIDSLTHPDLYQDTVYRASQWAASHSWSSVINEYLTFARPTSSHVTLRYGE